MSYNKKITIYLHEERIYKTLKHLCVDEGLSVSNLVVKLIKQHIDSGQNGTSAPECSTKVPEAPPSMGPIKDEEATFWQNQAKTFDNAMPLHPRPKKIPKIEPPEKSIRF